MGHQGEDHPRPTAAPGGGVVSSSRAPAALDSSTHNESVCVCVTGASGYVAGHIVKLLLAKGYRVHGTARDPDNDQAVAHLLALPGASERLRLFRADLLRPGSFLAAMQGCRYVVHTASPYTLTVRPGKEEEEMIRAAVAGTDNVLASVNATPSVTRVVLTSSTAAVFTDATERGRGHVFTEADWNCASRRLPYFASKTLAEQRAYEVAKTAGGRWSLVSINPGAIWGPPLSSRVDGESITQCLNLLSGVSWPSTARIGMGVVDVRDAARAHVAAMESEAACGRYLIIARSCFLLSEARAWLRAAHPQLWVPPLLGPWWGVLWCGPYMGLPRELARAMLDKLPAIDASKAARDLGMTPDSYITPRQSVLDMAEALLERGMVPAFRCPVMPLMVALTLVAAPLVAWGLLLLARALLALQQAWA